MMPQPDETRPEIHHSCILREIPYNFTSADDQQVVRLILGEEGWLCLEELRSQRITGRSAHLMMRFIGDLFMLHRNPFLLQELFDSLKGDGPALLHRLSSRVHPVANCCLEAGTLALSRPDIVNAMRLRKREQPENCLEVVEQEGRGTSEPIIATNCPSCLTGPGRNRNLGIRPTHFSVLFGENLAQGRQWRQEQRLLAETEERVVF